MSLNHIAGILGPASTVKILPRATMAQRQQNLPQEDGRNYPTYPCGQQSPYTPDMLRGDTPIYTLCDGSLAPPQNTCPRRSYEEEIDCVYKCGFNEKAYGTMNNLNMHVEMQSHGLKRTPEEFKKIRKQWKARRRQEAALRINMGLHTPVYGYEACAQCAGRAGAGYGPNVPDHEKKGDRRREEDGTKAVTDRV